MGRGKSNQIKISLMIDKDKYAQLGQLAEAHGTNRSEYMRSILYNSMRELSVKNQVYTYSNEIRDIFDED